MVKVILSITIFVIMLNVTLVACSMNHLDFKILITETQNTLEKIYAYRPPKNFSIDIKVNSMHHSVHTINDIIKNVENHVEEFSQLYMEQDVPNEDVIKSNYNIEEFISLDIPEHEIWKQITKDTAIFNDKNEEIGIFTKKGEFVTRPENITYYMEYVVSESSAIYKSEDPNAYPESIGIKIKKDGGILFFENYCVLLKYPLDHEFYDWDQQGIIKKNEL